MTEFWCTGGTFEKLYPSNAEAVEAEGWDGHTFADSQSLCAEPHVLMGAWAVATKRLKLCTGVTNPLTRHPAVTAAAAVTLQAISGGRAVLGIGRGDSALAYLGYAPVGLAAFERALLDLQALLSGKSIAFASAVGAQDVTSSETLSLSGRPGRTCLEWLPTGLPKVPLDVAATGPRVIEIAACIAERLTFSLGAIPERIEWGIGVAQSARERQGLPGDNIDYGAQVIVACHSDIEAATDFAASFVAPLARFQVIQGEAVGPQTDGDRENFAALRAGYDMNRHGEMSGLKKLSGTALTPEFVRRFAIIGPPEHCIRRLSELLANGLDRLTIVGPSGYPPSWGEARSIFANEVLPALRESLPTVSQGR